jgi:hypothetical protein
LNRTFYGVAVDARHRNDGSCVGRAFHDEERLHQMRNVNVMFAYERAHRRAATQTPRTY